ncbi:MAG: phage holin family protein [Eubacteriales bacterium]|nr:phage holin family protein [Eubacteriales bacterium]MDD3881407.1 phage holin family protein [Eubacteriales bacterium]MDD4513094.1 phage holin family protein [Eubacteriales bacterium]
MRDTQKIIAYIWNVIGVAASAVCTMLGGFDTALLMLVCVMGIDFAVGLIVAVCGKSPKSESGAVSSSAAFRGLTKKLLMLLVIMLCVCVDRITGADGICRLAGIGFYTANEGISILENVALLGVPFPQSVLEVLKTLKNDKENDNKSGS